MYNTTYFVLFEIWLKLGFWSKWPVQFCGIRQVWDKRSQNPTKKTTTNEQKYKYSNWILHQDLIGTVQHRFLEFGEEIVYVQMLKNGHNAKACLLSMQLLMVLIAGRDSRFLTLLSLSSDLCSLHIVTVLAFWHKVIFASFEIINENSYFFKMYDFWQIESIRAF